MKTITSIIVILLGTACQAQTTTLTQRFNLSQDNRPLHVTGLTFPNGLELWGIGITQKETTDLEVGYTFYSKGRWTFAGYLAWWPNAKQAFVMPWVTYSSPLASGQLTLNWAEYVPVRHGPRIKFSDNSRWVWKLNDQVAGGLAIQYGSDKVRFGLHLDLTKGDTMLRIRALPAGKNMPSSLRLEINRRFK